MRPERGILNALVCFEVALLGDVHVIEIERQTSE